MNGKVDEKAQKGENSIQCQQYETHALQVSDGNFKMVRIIEFALNSWQIRCGFSLCVFSNLRPIRSS